MPFVDGSAHPGRVRRVVDVSPVQTIHEKGGLDAVGLEGVEDLVGINIGTIIKCDGKRSRLGALGDDLSHGNGGDFHPIRRGQNLLRGVKTGGVHGDRVDGQGHSQDRAGCEVEKLHG